MEKTHLKINQTSPNFHKTQVHNSMKQKNYNQIQVLWVLHNFSW
jgi:hypothetical protein